MTPPPPPKPDQIYEGYADHVEMVDGVWTGGWRPVVEVTKIKHGNLATTIYYKYLNCSIPENVWNCRLAEFEREFSPERPQSPLPERLNFKPSKIPASEA